MENNNTSSKKKSFLAVWDNVELVDFVSKINFNALMKIEEELTILIEYLKMGMGVKNPTNLNEFFLHFTANEIMIYYYKALNLEERDRFEFCIYFSQLP